MKERPILFNGPMVRAILDGSKTQTRRALRYQPDYPIQIATDPFTNRFQYDGREPITEATLLRDCPYGQPGDRLWVRETWADLEQITDGSFARQAIYRADDIEQYGDEDEFVDVTSPDMCWRPSIHMPRWASRILLEITGVRVEQLQAIGEADARAEGVKIEERHTTGYCAGEFLPPSIRAYRDLWKGINGAGSRDLNPFVWVIEFRRSNAG